ncbi:MAG: hypothetical protein U0359_15070 [Byssovorax sp.]
MLRQHFTRIVLLTGDAQRISSCGVDNETKAIDQVWVARGDAYQVHGDLVPVFVDCADLSLPDADYCHKRTADAHCPAGPQPPLIPRQHCLSAHRLVTAAFQITGSPCVPQCADHACGDDACGGHAGAPRRRSAFSISV